MGSSAYEPVAVPSWAWHRPETRALLAARDVSGLFRLANHYGGASQNRIAAACGMSQSRVNEVINGRREVARFSVLMRIADGLNMPDHARADFGLAPRSPDREIVETFPAQEQAAEEIRRAAESASSVDILAVRGLGIIGLNSSLLKPAITSRPATVLRVLLLHPDCDAAARRAVEIGETPEQMATGIRVAEASLRGMAETGTAVELYFYDTLPVWRIIATDGVLYVSSFDSRWEGHQAEISKITPSPRGSLYRGFVRMLTELFSISERVV